MRPKKGILSVSYISVEHFSPFSQLSYGFTTKYAEVLYQIALKFKQKARPPKSVLVT